ncbi:hypothetical protein ACWDWV_01695, partial [Streptosporangium sandarakinum]
MKIKATLIGIGAALALTAGLAGLSGTAAAEPAKPAATPAPAPAEVRPTLVGSGALVQGPVGALGPEHGKALERAGEI